MATMTKTDEAYTIQTAELLGLLQRIVNGATRTMGTDSCGYEYAHIRQDILDLGREVLRTANQPVNNR